jgi:hypothetical protein
MSTRKRVRCSSPAEEVANDWQKVALMLEGEIVIACYIAGYAALIDATSNESDQRRLADIYSCNAGASTR